MPIHASHTWFDDPDRDGVAVAVITDDLRVEVNALGTVTICGWGGSDLQLDFDDASDVADVLVEAVRILRRGGHRTAYPHRLHDSTSSDPRSVSSKEATGRLPPEGDDADRGDTSGG